MSEVPLHMALDNIEFGTLVVDADGIVTFYSKSYERFLGIPRAQVLGRDVAEITELAQTLNLLESKLEYYERELEHLRSSKYTFDHIIGTSPAIEEAKRLALKAAEGSSTVLLLGESGVGKELFAHAIHRAGPGGCGSPPATRDGRPPADKRVNTS